MADPGDIVFLALTGSTPKDAGEKEARERQSRLLEEKRQAERVAREAKRKAEDAQYRSQAAKATKAYATTANRLKDPTARQAALKEGFALTKRFGAMPHQLSAWLDSTVKEPQTGYHRRPHADDRANQTALYAAAAIKRLRQDNPAAWRRLLPSTRRMAAAISAIRQGTAGPSASLTAEQRQQVLYKADSLLIRIGNEQSRNDFKEFVSGTFDLLTDLAPVVGEIKAIVEARQHLKDADAAEKAGDHQKANKLRALAGVSIAAILPWARLYKAGKFVGRITRTADALKKQRDPVMTAIDARRRDIDMGVGRKEAEKSVGSARPLFDPNRAFPKGSEVVDRNAKGFRTSTGTQVKPPKGDPEVVHYQSPEGIVEKGDAVGPTVRNHDGKDAVRKIQTPESGEIIKQRKKATGANKREKSVITQTNQNPPDKIERLGEGYEMHYRNGRRQLYNRDGFAVFHAIFEYRIRPKMLGPLDGVTDEALRMAHRMEASKQMHRHYGPERLRKMGFSADDIEDFRKGNTPAGYAWHHHEESGRMQLVDFTQHDLFKHTGGFTLNSSTK